MLLKLNIGGVVVENGTNDYYKTDEKVIVLSKSTSNNNSISSVVSSTLISSYAVLYNDNPWVIIVREKVLPIIKIFIGLSVLVFIIGLVSTIFISSNEKLVHIAATTYFVLYTFYILNFLIFLIAKKKSLNWIKKENIVNSNEYFEVKKLYNWVAISNLIPMIGLLSTIVFLVFKQILIRTK